MECGGIVMRWNVMRWNDSTQKKGELTSVRVVADQEQRREPGLLFSCFLVHVQKDEASG